VVVDDLLLKGKLDKIEFNGRDALIVDYKTGDPEKARTSFPVPTPKMRLAAITGGRRYFTRSCSTIMPAATGT
jgi:RecB family exonuclease